MHVAQRFERFLESYRRPDGGRWSGAQLDEATGGVVRRSYVTNLRKGRIESPGYEKMRAIAKTMGFPPELWFGSIRDGAWGVHSEIQTLFCRKNIHDRAYLYIDVTGSIGAGQCRVPGRVFSGVPG